MGRYLVIIDTAKHLQKHQEIQLIFERAFERNMVDIVVGLYAGNSTFIFYTYDIFLPQQCRQVVPRKFNIFKNGRLESAELFPYKLGNFHKCPIDIIVRNVEPYFSYNLTEDGENVTQFWGMQALMVRTMAKKLNFELRLHPWNESNTFSMVHKNGTATGVFQALQMQRIDMVMGYYQDLTRVRHFGITSSYFMTPVVVILPKYNKGLMPGIWLLAPFHKNVWLVIMAFLAFGCTLVAILHYVVHRSHATWLDIWGLALGNARSFHFRFISSKYFVLFYSMGFMILTGSFQGKLYGAFNTNVDIGPLTVSRLIAENYTFLIKKFVTADMINALQIPSEQIINVAHPKDEVTYEGMLEADRPLALLTNYWQFQAFVKSHQLQTAYDVVPHIVVMNHICAYVQPQSYLIEPMNRILTALNSGGLLKKWMLDVAGIFGTSNEVETVDRDRSNPEPNALTLRKFRLAFIILLTMYVASFMVFLVETIVHTLSKKW